jgi:hypothetical protein
MLQEYVTQESDVVTFRQFVSGNYELLCLAVSKHTHASVAERLSEQLGIVITGDALRMQMAVHKRSSSRAASAVPDTSDRLSEVASVDGESLEVESLYTSPYLDDLNDDIPADTEVTGYLENSDVEQFEQVPLI